MSSETIALGYGDHDGVALWVSPSHETPEGYRFYVFNGAWEGSFNNATQTISAGGKEMPGKELWRGVVPAGQGDYNGAIRWINEQLEKDR